MQRGDWLRSISTRLRLWLFVWRGPEEPHAREVRQTFIDLTLVALAFALPWSTTIASILVVAALLVIPPTLSTHSAGEIKRPALLLPILLFILAAMATTWAVDVPWSERMHALEKTSKLLLLPLVFIHFKQSRRAVWIFAAFVLSNVVLLCASSMAAFSTEFAQYIGSRAPGTPVKSYIDQSQAFAFLAVVLSGLSAESLRKAQIGRALIFATLAFTFLANLAFVNIARTAFAYLPIMIFLFLFRYMRRGAVVATTAAIVVLCFALFEMSPNLQRKFTRVLGDVYAFDSNSRVVGADPASGAERLEFWRKSIRFIQSAPLFGHGTGATKQLFEADAVGKNGLGSIVVANPHNQTLAVAIQWGVTGCILLYAMWASHLLFFRNCLTGRSEDLVTWVGLLAVSQNIASSIFNSHIFDFYQGWLYVLVVGIAGGQVAKMNTASHEERS